MPFELTPNPGGVHTVWLTPVSLYDASGRGSFGFAPDNSLTTNFQVGCRLSQTCVPPALSTINGTISEDLNANGGSGPSALSLAGRKIAVTGMSLGYPFHTVVFSSADGAWSVPDLDQGSQVTACTVVRRQGGPLSGSAGGIAVTRGARVTVRYQLNCWQGLIPTQGSVQGLGMTTSR
jgi:hypothetical protein